jgi:hypothetical protein
MPPWERDFLVIGVMMAIPSQFRKADCVDVKAKGKRNKVKVKAARRRKSAQPFYLTFTFFLLPFALF